MKKGLFILISILLVAFGVFLITKQDNDANRNNSDLIAVDKITHGHGLAVDIADSNKVYIATHKGLLVLMNDKELYLLGKSQDDYMGFSTHPTDPKVFFASGHPSSGGNIGFQKSEDGGITWKKISNGVEGPVDFHAMTVSSVNPDLIYGWYRGNLQRSMDGGENWEIINRSFLPLYLTTDLKDENVIYAATQQGILISRNKGVGWDMLSKDLEISQVYVLAINPQNAQEMFSFSDKMGLAKSSDGGSTWQKNDMTFDSHILFIAYNKQNPSIIYALSHNNSLYKSSNSGAYWSKIR